MSENKLLNLPFDFAVVIVNLVYGVTASKSSYMTDQLARAGTSVGANIHESQYVQGRKNLVRMNGVFSIKSAFGGINRYNR